MRVVQIDEKNQIIGKPFLIEMKVICVRKQSTIDFMKQKITEGKIYEVVSVQPYRSAINKGISHYRIIDDSGKLTSYWHSSFRKIVITND